MWRSVVEICLLLLVAGCSGTDANEPKTQGGASSGGSVAIAGTSPGGTSASGTSAGGGGSSSSGAAQGGGGSGGAVTTAGAASCAERWSEYDALAESARRCSPDAAMPECKFDIVVLDSCGCSVPANGSSPDYVKARQRLTKYVEDCEFPEKCAGCPASLQAGCADDGTGNSRCVYQ